MTSLSTNSSDEFIHYFCYGSNMLHKRILINNKSASKHSNGLLKGYRYSFSGDSNLWKGATANILPDLNQNVYGVIYNLSKNDIINLDRQEIGYLAIDVDVQPLEQCGDAALSNLIKCRTYVQRPEYSIVGTKTPSLLYKQIIIKGAEENQLPQNYIECLRKNFPDNGCVDCGPRDLVI